MGADCKSAGYAYAGSNPARPTTKYKCPCGSVVEHTLGKGEVASSILATGFISKDFYVSLCKACRALFVVCRILNKNVRGELNGVIWVRLK